MNHLGYLPDAVSTFAADIDFVMTFIYVVCGVWFIAAEAVLLSFILKYRKKDGQRAAWVTGEGKAAAWVLAPVFLVVLCDVAIESVSAPVWDKVKIDIPENPAVTVRVTARQFSWLFTYAGPDGAFDTEDDISAAEIVVPVGETVKLELQSMDALHSFYVPELRLKQDIVPGRRIPAWFEANRTGDFTVACAELCGKGHTVMKSKLRVLSADAFDAWLKEREGA